MPDNTRTTPIKRLSLERRVDLIIAFYRDAANQRFKSKKHIEEAIAHLRQEIRRQIEHAIRDDRDLREPFIQVIKERVSAIEHAIVGLGREGIPFELTDEELCPSCGVPAKLHGTVHTGKWLAFVCAGITGSKMFISPDVAAAVVDALTEKNDGEPEPGTSGDDVRDTEQHGDIPLSGE